MAFDHNKDHLEAWTAAMFPPPSLVASGDTSVTMDGEEVSLAGSGGCVQRAATACLIKLNRAYTMSPSCNLAALLK
jgi:hypothetical protein